MLAAIAGSGIQAGPVKFPSIPSSRQKPLAIASAVVVAGGVLWWVIQQQSETKTPPPSQVAQTGAVADQKLKIDLIPANSNIRVGDALSVLSEVYDSHGDQIGTGQCELRWSDTLSGWNATTACDATFSEPSVTKVGVHRIVARADGRNGILGKGSNSIEVTVRR